MGKIAIIGGSGFYGLADFGGKKVVRTSFGQPSDFLSTAKIGDTEAIFLPRHGQGHLIPPHEINYRANIWALKSQGVDRILSVTACGSLKEHLRPLDFVIVDQFIDLAVNRKNTFFDTGCVAHVSMANPVCPALRKQLISLSRRFPAVTIHTTGTYLNINGPHFSSRAESAMYQQFADVIGMTNATEAKLAREAGICYATLACVTDYDSWHPEFEHVTVEMILDNLRKNVEHAQKLVQAFLTEPYTKPDCNCGESLKYALITDPKKRRILTKMKKCFNHIRGA